MKYGNTEITAQYWMVSERSVRNYCSNGRVPGAVRDGRDWKIPLDAEKPARQKRHVVKNRTLLKTLIDEKSAGYKNGVYRKVQVLMTYNSNHIEGSKLTEEQTASIFETNTVFDKSKILNVDDIIETKNHFRCVDLVIENAKSKLSESFIKMLHYTLKSNTSDADKPWFKVGDYKLLENEVGGRSTALPSKVHQKMKELIERYNSIENVTVNDIIDFHFQFEAIHPFQDGNGRIGRLIMLKECLKHDITPIIIFDDVKMFYYRGLSEYPRVKEYLTDTCLSCQDRFLC